MEGTFSNIQGLSIGGTSDAPGDASKKGVSTDQLKRLLALIENNAQANALQRETTMNVLLRLELLEKSTNNGVSTGLPPVLM